MSELTEEQKADRKQLFLRYDVTAEGVSTAEGLLEKSKADRSAVVKEINDKYGAGPYRVGGELLRIASRNGTYFFRGVKVTGEEI